MNNKIAIAKFAVRFVVKAGATKIIYAIIKNNIEPEHLYDTVAVAAGSYVLGSLVADAAGNYTDNYIDGFVTGFKAFRKAIIETPIVEEPISTE